MASVTPDLMLTFPAAERHHPLASTRLYCLVNRDTCEQPAQGCYLAVPWLGVEPATFVLQVQHHQATQVG